METKHINKASQKREYFFENETGDAHVAVYDIFPGVEVAFASVHMDQFDFTETEQEHKEQYVGFYYCKEGRIEQEQDNEFFYLMPGDCSVIMRDKPVKKFKLPMKHYHGISIGIDVSKASERFTAFMQSESMSPQNVAAHICGSEHSAVLRSSSAVNRIFTDIYEAKEELRAEHLKIKLLELFFTLNNIDNYAAGSERNMVPRAQVEFVKRAAKFISENINEKLSVKQLTMKFGVSDTYLQNSFRCVYGMPVMSFIRSQKMQSAAQVLIHTLRSVDDIAAEFGYENESKFSATFKKIMGDTPSVYRKEHSKVKVY